MNFILRTLSKRNEAMSLPQNRLVFSYYESIKFLKLHVPQLHYKCITMHRSPTSFPWDLSSDSVRNRDCAWTKQHIVSLTKADVIQPVRLRCQF